MEECFRVSPQDLGLPRESAITAAIDAALLDRVIQGLGLCVTLFDVLEIETGEIYPNDGGVWFKAVFRVVVFRPFVGEVLVGKISRETKVLREGLQVTLGFFEDIIVPEHYLPVPSFFEPHEGVWYWTYTNEEGETNRMYMEPDEDIRLKVKSVKFPPPPPQDEIAIRREKDPEFGTQSRPFAPMQIVGEISTTGLGPISWWRPMDENDQELSSD